MRTQESDAQHTTTSGCSNSYSFNNSMQHQRCHVTDTQPSSMKSSSDEMRKTWTDATPIASMIYSTPCSFIACGIPCHRCLTIWLINLTIWVSYFSACAETVIDFVHKPFNFTVYTMTVVFVGQVSKNLLAIHSSTVADFMTDHCESSDLDWALTYWPKNAMARYCHAVTGIPEYQICTFCGFLCLS